MVIVVSTVTWRVTYIPIWPPFRSGHGNSPSPQSPVIDPAASVGPPPDIHQHGLVVPVSEGHIASSNIFKFFFLLSFNIIFVIFIYVACSVVCSFSLVYSNYYTYSLYHNLYFSTVDRHFSCFQSLNIPMPDFWGPYSCISVVRSSKMMTS